MSSTNTMRKRSRKLPKCSFGLRTCTVMLWLVLTCTSALANDPLHVTFINPSYQTSVFWKTVTDFMQAAADDLGIELTVVYASKSSEIDRQGHVQLFKNAVTGPKKPDFIVTHFRKSSAKMILDIAEKAQVKTFIFNTEASADEKAIIGLPREKYTYWIGHMSPNDTLAGYDLAQILMRDGKKLGFQGPDGKLEIAGISGNQHSMAALNRNKGLQQAVKDAGQTLDQIVFARWKTQVAKEYTTKLLQRYPGLTLFWNASDDMSLGTMQGIEQAGKIPGKQMLTGGFDWRPQVLAEIKKGKITVSGGGHFMEGGWAMVMLYDYAHGKDFAESTAKFETQLTFIDQSNVDDYLKHFNNSDWDKIDFQKFSKVYTPLLKKYDFTLNAIFSQLIP